MDEQTIQQSQWSGMDDRLRVGREEDHDERWKCAC